ncbi:MAG: hypothetical protein ACI4AA_05820 [Lachnospiraceae bacterium]
MIISSSTVGMSSKRDYIYYEQKESASISEKAGQAVRLEVSQEGKSLMEQFKDYQLEKKEQQEKRQQENLQQLIENGRLTQAEPQTVADGVSDRYQLKLELIRRLIRALQGMDGNDILETADKIKQIRRDYHRASSSFTAASSWSAKVEVSVSRAAGSATVTDPTAAGAGSNVWTRTTVTSAFVSEAEYTAFETAGIARTADGREIDFGVSVEMSRAFCAKYESFTQQNYVVTDPLMINLDSGVASISDMKFFFDIDADGKEEEVSLAGKGSGFLALDKNGDGEINDGSELFGTRSGDGFADLAVYDEDGNGWIDEGDSIFKELKVWTKDEDGTDVLLDLKGADVGAIYLGHADTEFSLKNLDTNDTNGIIRKTGIFLKESGGVGTVQHVDLAV